MFTLIFSKLNLPFLNFIAHEDSYTRKRNQITITRKIKDTERYIYRKKRTRSITLFSLIKDMRTS